MPKSYAVNLLISVDSLKCENINWRRFWHLTLHYRRIKGLFEMSKTYAEPITVRCMPVRKVSELRLTSCWRVQKNLSRRQGSCDGLSSRVQLLSINCADQKHDGKLLTDTQFNAHWFRQPWCCVLISNVLFCYLISCDYAFKLCMNISKHYVSAISVRDIWLLSYFLLKSKKHELK